MMERYNADSLYIHFPFCRHLCNYCDFYKKVPQNRGQELSSFHQFLEDSWIKHEELLSREGYQLSPLKTLYFGGGTPSLWDTDGVNFLENFFIEKGLKLDPSGEFTLEVNPGTWTEQGLKRWREFGVNRFSLGIQSLRSDFLKVLDRVHSLQDVHDTLTFFGENKFNFSVDFMLGLPLSKEMKRDVIAELEEILKYGPSHISLYILTVKGGYPYKDKLPDDEWIEDEYLKVSRYLKDKGFLHYEVSNFAFEGKESRHNLNYWKSSTVMALGPSATGYLGEAGIRYKWKTSAPDYVVESLNESEQKLEKFYMALRTNEGVNLSYFFSDDVLVKVKNKALEWEAKGLLDINNNDRITLSSKGYLILDSLLDEVFLLDPSF